MSKKEIQEVVAAHFAVLEQHMPKTGVYSGWQACKSQFKSPEVMAKLLGALKVPDGPEVRVA